MKKIVKKWSHPFLASVEELLDQTENKKWESLRTWVEYKLWNWKLAAFWAQTAGSNAKKKKSVASWFWCYVAL